LRVQGTQELADTRFMTTAGDPIGTGLVEKPGAGVVWVWGGITRVLAASPSASGP
jgi:hypothetical protein